MRNQQIKSFFTLALLVVATIGFSQTHRNDTTRILFIGNSYTYFNSCPELLKALAQEKFSNQVVETQLISDGGLTLKLHWEEGKALEAIKSKKWDYVILQEQSKLGMGVLIDNDMYFGKTEMFFEYARKFDSEIKKSGAQTVFFMTWSVKDRPQEQEILTYAYTEIARELDAILAPIGLVWNKVRTNDEVDLYFRDGSHPSPLGSYLTASTLFATLFEVSPIGLSGKIVGNKLSSKGALSLKPQSLVSIAPADAQIVQVASWEVVKTMHKVGYPITEQPLPNYVIPVLTTGESINQKKLAGRWYGTTTYGSNYLGLILDVQFVKNKLMLGLSFYSPDRQDRMIVEKAELEEDQLHLTIFDSLRTLKSDLKFSLVEEKLSGLSESFGARIYQYKHWNLSRSSMLNNVDMEHVDKLMQTFKTNTVNQGYVKAAINHYEQYSKLVGKAYLPEERYLNAMGYNYLRDNKLEDALNQFELAVALYPQSVNTYDSYGEGLQLADQKEKALKIYTKGYELAIKTNDRNLAYIESKLRKLEEEFKKDEK